jgi:hypothetical protein
MRKGLKPALRQARMPALGKTRSFAIGLSCLVAAFAGACGGDESKQSSAGGIQGVTIVGKDFSFKMPASIEAGWTDFTLTAKGKQPHQFTFLKLNPGVSYAKIKEVLKDERTGNESLELTQALGGANAIRPGESLHAILNVKPGEYAVVCFTRGHHHKGMIKHLTVTGKAKSGEKAPKADGEVVLEDFKITLPGSIGTGSGRFKVVNSGPSPHELQLFRAEGAPFEKVKSFMDKLIETGNFEARPPFRPIEDGGMSVMDTKKSGFVDLDLEPGAYVAVCFVFDEKSKEPHFFKGMLESFEVK